MQRSTVDAARTGDTAIAGSNRVRRSARPSDPLGGTAVDQQTAMRIQRASGGVALPDTLRRTAERESGRDLGGVRVHTGASAADLNDRVQATAFTVGRNIFLGGDAARPGSASGNRLLAHEVGHVVEEGGGGGAAIGRVQRRADLRPLDAGAAPTVRRLFGSGKRKRQKEEQRQAALQASIRATAEREAENHPHFAPLKSTVAKVEQCVARLRTDPLYDLATYGPIIMNWCREIGAQFEGAEGDPGFGPLKARLRIAIDDVQIMYDHDMVKHTKMLAGERYMHEGRDGNFQALTSDMRTSEFLGNATGVKAQDAASRRAAGEALGLSKAEQTAITVFTAQDYKYINPAAANNRSWMLSQRSDPDGKVSASGPKKTNTRVQSQMEDQYVATRSAEGSLHAGMAMQGLNKLPVVAGTTFRGEAYRTDNLPKEFAVDKKGRIIVRNTTVKRLSLVSASTERETAESFAGLAAGDLKLGSEARSKGYLLLWEFTVTNGRNLEALSASGNEKEIATLPGAEFKIVSLKAMDVQGHPFLNGYQHVFAVKAVQVK